MHSTSTFDSTDWFSVEQPRKLHRYAVLPGIVIYVYNSVTGLKSKQKTTKDMFFVHDDIITYDLHDAATERESPSNMVRVTLDKPDLPWFEVHPADVCSVTIYYSYNAAQANLTEQINKLSGRNKAVFNDILKP